MKRTIEPIYTLLLLGMSEWRFRRLANLTADSEGAAPAARSPYLSVFIPNLYPCLSPDFLSEITPLIFSLPSSSLPHRTDTQTFIYSHFYSGQEILGGRGSPPKSFPRHVAKSRPMCPSPTFKQRRDWRCCR